MTAKDRLVLPLENIESSEMQQHGGKAANLARLHHAGFQIPKGFSIASDCFGYMIKEIPQMQEIIDLLDRTEDYEDVLEGATALQVLATNYELPAELESMITYQFNELEKKVGRLRAGFAVRSSATVEDGAYVSFAGQAETFLCVSKAERILEKVKQTWVSALAPGAAIYLKSKGIPISDVRMGVVVQEMISADVAGVMFTANVVVGDLTQVIVEASWGLGELLVAGKIIPDTYIVDKESMDKVEKKIGSKELTAIPGTDGEESCVIHKETPEDRRVIFTLNDSDLQRVVRLGLEIEEEFGVPQDIEWCIRDDEIIILQTRPITTIHF